MTAENGYVYVPQRRYVILAPDHDKNKVKGAATWAMGPCFGLALVDKAAKLGMFTHLDYVEDFQDAFEKTTTLLADLGATRLTIETVNIGKFTAQRKIYLDRFVTFLINARLSENVNWRDIGRASQVGFEPQFGIMIATMEGIKSIMGRLPVPDEEYENKVSVAWRKGERIAIECIYTPSL